MRYFSRLFLTVCFFSIAGNSNAQRDTALAGRLRMLYANADYRQVITLADSVLQGDSLNADWWRLRGFMRQFLKEHPQALVDFKQSIRLSPLNPATYFAAAESYYSLYRFEEAETMYTNALARTSTDDSGYASLLIKRGNARGYQRKWLCQKGAV